MTRSEVDRVGIATGDIDFTLRPGATLVAAARGLPVRVIFITAAKSMWAMVARPEFTSPRDLKGKTVGIGGFSGANHLTAKAIFKQHKLDPDKDIVYKVLTGSQVAAIQAGAIDAMLMNYNEAALARKLGYRVLLNAADYHNSITSGVGAGTRLLKDHPERVKRFLRAMVKGLKYLRENRDGTREIAMSWLKLDRESADAVLDLSMSAFTTDGTLDDANLKLLTDQMMADANIKPVPVSQLVDLSFLRQVLR